MIRLETSRLLFRDHELADLEPFCEMESDPEYRRPQRVHPREELERKFRGGPLVPKPLGLLATVHKPDGRYIGRCGLYPFRNERSEIVPHEAFLAYYLARPGVAASPPRRRTRGSPTGSIPSGCGASRRG